MIHEKNTIRRKWQLANAWMPHWMVLEADNGAASVFAATLDGLLSNEFLLPRSHTVHKIELTTKGGWRQPGYPQPELLE